MMGTSHWLYCYGVVLFLSLIAVHHTGGTVKLHKRAIGGREVSRGRQPWLVLLKATLVTQRFLGIPVGHRHLYCGGTVINDRWVITAAHCFTEYGSAARRASNWEVRLASTTLRASPGERLLHILGTIFDRDDWLQWEIDVERIVLHPQYNNSNLWVNDIALLKLERPVPSGTQFSYIRHLELPSARSNGHFPRVGQTCTMTGWGCTSNGGGPSRVAREISLPVYSQSRCRQHYGLGTMHNRICAGYRNRGIGVCSGDSGSSLVCNENGRDVVAGITSFTSRDTPGGFPAIFTDVGPYVNWIRSIVQ